MWLSTQTRPDMSNAVRAVASFSAPMLVHWKEALGMLGYVRRTSSIGFTVGGLRLQVFANAD